MTDTEGSVVVHVHGVLSLPDSNDVSPHVGRTSPKGQRQDHCCMEVQVENLEALHNFDSIAGAADAVILSRGNLGLDVAPEKTAVVQKAAINRCNLLVCSLHHITAAWCGCDSSVCD